MTDVFSACLLPRQLLTTKTTPTSATGHEDAHKLHASAHDKTVTRTQKPRNVQTRFFEKTKVLPQRALDRKKDIPALRSLKGVGAQSPFWLMWAAHFFVEPVRMGDTVWSSPQMFVQ